MRNGKIKIELREITNGNIGECALLEVEEKQKEYIASNEDSLKEAKENSEIARPFMILADGKMVGFTMFAFDEKYEDENDKYWL